MFLAVALLRCKIALHIVVVSLENFSSSGQPRTNSETKIVDFCSYFSSSTTRSIMPFLKLIRFDFSFKNSTAKKNAFVPFGKSYKGPFSMTDLSKRHKIEPLFATFDGLGMFSSS